MEITTVGLDLAKSVFQVHAVNRQGKKVLNKQLKRNQLAEFFVRRSGQRGDVAIRHDQQVAVVVRIQVEDDVAGLTAKDDERRLPEGCRVVS